MVRKAVKPARPRAAAVQAKKVAPAPRVDGRVAGAIAEHSPGEVFAATLRANLYCEVHSQRRTAPLEELLPDGKAVLSAVQGESAVLRKLDVSDGVHARLADVPAFGIQILAELDPTTAEPLARELFETEGAWGTPGAAVRLAAARALGRLSTPGDVEALVRGLGGADPFSSAAGLARARPEVAGPPLLVWLVPKRLEAAAKEPVPKIQNVALAVQALGVLGYAPAVEPLAKAWRSRKASSMRVAIGACLLEVGTDEALRALEGEVDADDDDVARIAMTARLRRDPPGALKTLKPELSRARAKANVAAGLKRISSGKEPRDLAYRALRALAGRPFVYALYHAPSLEQPRPAEWRPLMDASWIAAAASALDEESLSHLAVTYLGATRDPAAARALAKYLVDAANFDAVAHALEYVGDATILPALEASAAKVDRERGARIRLAIARIRRGERPSSVIIDGT